MEKTTDYLSIWDSAKREESRQAAALIFASIEKAKRTAISAGIDAKEVWLGRSEARTLEKEMEFQNAERGDIDLQTLLGARPEVFGLKITVTENDGVRVGLSFGP